MYASEKKSQDLRYSPLPGLPELFMAKYAHQKRAAKNIKR
jgi:hypothetical protein